MERSWPALVVEKVAKDQLRWNADGRIDTENLPIEPVYISSTHDFKSMAVLSWRWDPEPGKISRNVFAAVLYARHAHITHLLIDAVSIDQALNKQQLIEEVVAFSHLYSHLPAIEAYDKEGENGWLSFRRPWIFHEQRLMRKSPYVPISVRHDLGSGAHDNDVFEAISQLSVDSHFQSAVLILFGTVGMTEITDFRFLIPSFSKALAALGGQMTRNDYLLTAAILGGLEEKSSPWAPKWVRIEDLDFERFSFRKHKKKLRVRHDVFLDDVKIGEWTTPTMLESFTVLSVVKFLMNATMRLEKHAKGGPQSTGVKRFEFVENARWLVVGQLGVDQNDGDINVTARKSTARLGNRERAEKTWDQMAKSQEFLVDFDGETVTRHFGRGLVYRGEEEEAT